MIQYLLRFNKRLFVLLPGIIIAYFSVRNIFPYFNRRLPLGFAILITYAIGAYVLAPALIRLFRIIRPANHLPLYCITPDGFASDPLNIAIIGTKSELTEAMIKAGWLEADPHSPRKMIRHILSIVYGWSYPTAPVSSLYLMGHKQDIAFEIPIGNSPRERHHVRFWATAYDPTEPLNSQTISWLHRREQLESDTLLWVGAASLDIGVGYIRHNLQLTHMIDPDTNRERDLIIEGLKTAGLVKKVRLIKLGEPYRLINRVMHGQLHTDGKLAIVTLK